LSGKILMKGQLADDDGQNKSGAAELALRLIDEDARIASLARLFFTEFAKKDAKNIDKLLPDVVSALARDASLAPEAFREVVGFLITKVPKGKDTESMIDKICPRFSLSDAQHYLRSIATCVCELNHTDKSIRKLLEHKRSFGNKLGDEDVLGCFTSLVVRMRKAQTAQQPELKPALDELEDFLKRRAAGDETVEDEDENVPPTAREAAAAPPPPTKSRPVKRSAARKVR